MCVARALPNKLVNFFYFFNVIIAQMFFEQKRVAYGCEYDTINCLYEPIYHTICCCFFHSVYCNALNDRPSAWNFDVCVCTYSDKNINVKSSVRMWLSPKKRNACRCRCRCCCRRRCRCKNLTLIGARVWLLHTFTGIYMKIFVHQSSYTS